MAKIELSKGHAIIKDFATRRTVLAYKEALFENLTDRNNYGQLAMASESAKDVLIDSLVESWQFEGVTDMLDLPGSDFKKVFKACKEVYRSAIADEGATDGEQMPDLGKDEKKD